MNDPLDIPNVAGLAVQDIAAILRRYITARPDKDTVAVTNWAVIAEVGQDGLSQAWALAWFEVQQ